MKAVIHTFTKWAHYRKTKSVLVRNEGSDTYLYQMGTLPEDEVGASSIRQCISSPVYKPTMGNSVSPSVSARNKTVADDRGESNSATSSTHTVCSRDPQCSSGSIEQTEDQNLSNRMVSKRNDCSKDLVRYYNPHIDLFASAMNHKLPTYCSWQRDPKAWALDSLSIPWAGMLDTLSLR
jgi:hypothetical protein